MILVPKFTCPIRIKSCSLHLFYIGYDDKYEGCDHDISHIYLGSLMYDHIL